MRAERILQAYWVRLDPLAARYPELARHLSREEADRAAQFRAPVDHLRYVVRHGWMREQLAAILGETPAAIPIVRERFGKPRIPGAPIGFSLSQSHGAALLVIGPDAAIGCDIAWRDPSFDVLAIAERFFSCGEWKALRSLDPGRQLSGFYHAWTCKEAYVKALGEGLSIPLDGFEVALDPDLPPALLRGCDGWSVAAFEPFPGFQAAVVAVGQWRLMRGVS